MKHGKLVIIILIFLFLTSLIFAGSCANTDTKEKSPKTTNLISEKNYSDAENNNQHQNRHIIPEKHSIDLDRFTLDNVHIERTKIFDYLDDAYYGRTKREFLSLIFDIYFEEVGIMLIYADSKDLGIYVNLNTDEENFPGDVSWNLKNVKNIEAIMNTLKSKGLRYDTLKEDNGSCFFFIHKKVNSTIWRITIYWDNAKKRVNHIYIDNYSRF